jgi:chromate transporter
MENEVVTRRRWLDRQQFLDLVATLHFIPGPNSTELAIHLGLIRAGTPGLIVAGVCFILPAVLIILPMAFLYVRHAGPERSPPAMLSGALAGIGAVVVAILAVTSVRLVRTAITGRLTLCIALLAVPAELLVRHFTQWQSEIVVLSASALVAMLAHWPRRPGGTLSSAVSASVLPWLATPAAEVPASTVEWARLAWFFVKVGGTMFGSGYVLVNYLETGLVRQLGWLTPQQLVDAVAIGQVTPGPLLTTATFVGYVRGYAIGGSDLAGVGGALLATVAIFLPAFLLVALFGRVLPSLRRHSMARAALDGMNAAVVALLVLVTARLALGLAPEGRVDWLGMAIACASTVAMLRWNLNSTWLILLAAGLGAARSCIG